MKYLIFFCFLMTVVSCKDLPKNAKLDDTSQEDVQKFLGETMGTYYNIRISPSVTSISQASLDSILQVVNQDLSTYIPSSTISRVNSSQQEIVRIIKKESPHFVECYLIAKTMAERTRYNFEPTLNPIINFWGFGYDKEAFAQKDTTLIPELLKLVNFSVWTEFMEGDSILVIQKPAKASLDLSAIAKGYGVDVVSRFLASKGANGFLVDIGGEVRASGKKVSGDPWVIGINSPQEGASPKEAIIYMKIENESVATSGNYRNFYIENGRKFSHIISPRTGKPYKTNILSATVVSKSCANADATATALMVTKFENVQKIMEMEKDFEAFIIYIDDEGKQKTWNTQNFPWRIMQ